ncbi:MAG: PEP-CTERM sorting domain-containing protein [Immundisolibacter sp.]|uniref:PEP-CTERM sorting domain-containing protein n=1 Tax=Immundisolibacter sp. TaxID=1934948 RepID=UPI00198E576F|nr:PEP-CTERM sorting domain-containing protein [Immundisolibacter sp.]MBC7161955.1 PEP-CTERM sorting domain-containing protein [Immundisolibacter sp.]
MQTTLKLTTLAGAVALALGAGQASANIVPASTGNSEMVLSVWDSARQAGYTLDMGIFQSTLTPAGVSSQSGIISNSTPLQMSFAPDALLTQFLADSTANGSLGSVRWNVVGGDSTGTTLNTRKILTTALSSVTEATIEALSGVQMGNMLGAFNVYVSQAQSGTLGTHDTQENGSNIEVIGDGLGNDQAYSGSGGWGAAFGGWANFSNAGWLDQGLNFWSLSNGAAVSSKISATQFFGASAPAIWTLASDGTLTFAAVPEAETWALLGLGLLGAGAVARRRSRALA